MSNERQKIFIEQQPQTGDFLMRMPKEAVADLYQMIISAPLPSRRTFYQVKEYLEENYKEAIQERRPMAAAGNSVHGEEQKGGVL